MGKKSTSNGGKYRSAKTGQYVKPSYGKSHPNATVKETDRKKK